MYDIKLKLVKDLESDDLHVYAAAGCQHDLFMYTKAGCPDDAQVWAEATEAYWTNGWDLLTPEDLGALTDDPYLIGNEVDRDDEGRLTHVANVWHFPDYQLRSIFEDVYKQGHAVMKLAPDTQPKRD